MADVLAHTSSFPRGSAVLDYWLVHAQGLTVEPLGATVEGVVVSAPFTPPKARVVRNPHGEERVIPVEAIAAVEPAAGRLLLDGETRVARRLPRPSQERVAQARAVARDGASRAAAVGATAFVWLRPRAIRVAVACGRGIRLACGYVIAGTVWLTPRVVAAARASAAAGVRGAHSLAVWIASRTDRSARAPRTRP
jgi:hypothetical protein